MQGTNFRYLYKRQIYRGLGGYKQCNNCRGCGSTYTVPFHRDVSLHFALVCTFKNDTAYTLTLDINLTYNNSFADMSTLIAHVCFDDSGSYLNLTIESLLKYRLTVTITPFSPIPETRDVFNILEMKNTRLKVFQIVVPLSI